VNVACPGRAEARLAASTFSVVVFFGAPVLEGRLDVPVLAASFLVALPRRLSVVGA
jgi:hypothetical protein